MKIYLDTSMIYEYFEKIIKNQELPKVFKYLYNVRKQHKYFVSNLTKAEIFRHLHSTLNISLKDCNAHWDTFKKVLNIVEIKVREIDFDEISKLLGQRPARRNTIVNIQHLMIAKENGLTVLTGDLPLKERFKIFYKEIMAYDELRKLSLP